MGKTLCEMDKKKRKKQLAEPGKYECSECERRVDKKSRVCKPVKI